MGDLNQAEKSSLIDCVVKLKDYIKQANLLKVYEKMAIDVAGTKSEAFVNHTLARLHADNRPPDDFNDGLNDGPTAGQTVPHFHWHIMPRWAGDSTDARGGIRHMFQGLGNYHTGVKK